MAKWLYLGFALQLCRYVVAVAIVREFAQCLGSGEISDTTTTLE